MSLEGGISKEKQSQLGRITYSKSATVEEKMKKLEIKNEELKSRLLEVQTQGFKESTSCMC